MPHIHTGEGEHDLTASAFIVRKDTDEPRLLLHTHKLLHILLQPGGHVELTENPWQAIKHELLEEAGYDIEQLRLLQPKDRIKTMTNTTLLPYPVSINTHNFDHEGHHKHTDIAMAFTATGEPAHRPDEGESTDLRWLSYQELSDLDGSRIPENVREIGQYVLTTAFRTWEEVDPRVFG